MRSAPPPSPLPDESNQLAPAPSPGARELDTLKTFIKEAADEVLTETTE